MKFVAAIVLLLLPLSSLYAQCSESKIKAKLELANQQRRKNPTKSKAAAKSALECAEKLKADNYINKSLNVLGFHNLMEGNTAEAYKQFRRSLDVSDKIKNDSAIAIAQNNLGNYYNFLGLDELALEHYLKSLKLKKKIKLDGVDVGLVNVGIIYDKQGKHQEALEFYQEALEIKRSKNDDHGVALVYGNMGIAEAELDNYDSAFDYFNKAVAIYERIGFDQGVLAVKISKSVLYVEMNQTDKSEAILKEIKTGVLSSKDVTKIRMWYKVYFDIELIRENFTAAIALGDSSLKYAELTQDLSSIIASYDDLSKVYEAIGNEFEALSNSNRALVLKDSLNTLNSEVAIEELQLRYETEVLNNKIEVQRKNIELLNLENRNRLYLIGLILLVAAAVILGIYLKYRANARQKESLKSELDKSNKELLSFTVQTAKKNEAIQKLKDSLHTKADGNSFGNEKEIQHLFREVERTEDNWQEFKMRFEKIDPNFFQLLSSKYQLSETDLRICALIKLNVTTQEAANMLNITSDSVNKARYRLRKKLELPKEVELNSFVRSIS